MIIFGIQLEGRPCWVGAAQLEQTEKSGILRSGESMAAGDSSAKTAVAGRVNMKSRRKVAGYQQLSTPSAAEPTPSAVGSKYFRFGDGASSTSGLAHGAGRAK